MGLKIGGNDKGLVASINIVVTLSTIGDVLANLVSCEFNLSNKLYTRGYDNF